MCNADVSAAVLEFGHRRSVVWTVLVDSVFLQPFTVTCVWLCSIRSVLASATSVDILDFCAGFVFTLSSFVCLVS